MFAEHQFAEGLWSERTAADAAVAIMESSRRNLFHEAMWCEFPWAGEADFLVIPEQPGLRFGQGSKVGQQA